MRFVNNNYLIVYTRLHCKVQLRFHMQFHSRIRHSNELVIATQSI